MWLKPTRVDGVGGTLPATAKGHHREAERAGVGGGDEAIAGCQQVALHSVRWPWPSHLPPTHRAAAQAGHHARKGFGGAAAAQGQFGLGGCGGQVLRQSPQQQGMRRERQGQRQQAGLNLLQRQ